MHRLTTWLCLLLTVVFGLCHSKGHAARDYPNYNYAACTSCVDSVDPLFYEDEELAPPCPDHCPPKCPPQRCQDSCSPCAAICGVECGISICAIAVAIAALVAAAAIILSAGDGHVGN